MSAAAAAHSSAHMRVLALLLVSLGTTYLTQCQFDVLDGVFSCANGERCPSGQMCGPDKLCHTHVVYEHDASSADSDSGSSETNRDAAVSGDSGAPVGGSGSRADSGAPASGAGGSGGSAGMSAGEPFKVATTRPSAHGVLDDLGSSIQLTFSAPVNADSITNTSVRLLRSGAEVPGTLEVARTGLTFKPAQPLALAGSYELQLTEAVVDTKERALVPFSLAFRTRDGHWQRERRVDGVGAALAMADDGFAMMVWSQAPAGDVPYPEMWAAQFTAPSTWSAPVQIKSGTAGAFLNAVAVNRRHHAAVSWSSISSNVSTTAYTSGPAWGPDTYVAQTAYDSHMQLNEQDEVLIVAQTSAAMPPGLVGARYTLGAVSPAKITVGGSEENNTKPGGLAVLNGEPYVVWQHAASAMSGASTKILAGTLSNLPGTPLSADTLSAANPVLAGDSRQTSLIAAWEQADPSWTNIWASRLVSGASWTAPVRLSSDQSSATNVRLALDPTGRAVAIWKQAGAIVGAHFAPGVGWSGSETISAPDAMNIDVPELALDAEGNGIAAWTQDGASSGLNEVWAARYLRDDGWQTSGRVRISDLEAGTGSVVNLAVDGYGRAFVLWIQENAVWAARFD